MRFAPLLPRVALFASLLLVLLVGCSKQEEAPAPSPGEPAKVPLTLALNWVPEPEFGGFYAGKQSGAYAKEGIELTIQGGGAGVPVVQMVATGKVDFGIAGADEVLSARARGADVVALYAVFQKSPQGIMAHASRGAKSLADVFASGTLAIEPGLPYAAFLKKKYGFDKLKVVPYDGGVARFLADPEFAQQCFVTSEPIAAKKQGGDPQVFLVADEGFDPYLAVVIARRAFVTEKKDLARAFVRATREGWKAYLADPKPANALMAPLNRSMDAEAFAAASEAQRPLIETAETKARGLGVMTKERWQALGAELLALGLLPQAVPPEDVLAPLD
jgi:NitT/TauT family transport system substrate-binding protein